MKPTTSHRYRSRDLADRVIGLSIGYQRDHLLARGLGFEHLREMLLGLGRLLLRQGASLAYGGGWKEAEDNFTYELLRLISAEQEDNRLGGPDSNLTIGRLYNHTAWPYYLDITPQLEAQWINCCRIVRITQQAAGFTDEEIVPDADVASGGPRVHFNRVLTQSVMRRRMLEPMRIEIPEAAPEPVPPVCARVTLGGKVQDYSGVMPGIFEEALTALEKGCPLFLLGGFGGAAEVLANAIARPDGARPPELIVAWHEKHSAGFSALLKSFDQFRLPPPLPAIPVAFEALWQFIEAARAQPGATLRTSLTDEETRELLTTRDMNTAVRLVRAGLANQHQLRALPA